MFHLHWTDATRLCGLYREALAAVETLTPEAEGVWGTEYPDTLTTRYLTASCLRHTGDAAAALEELETLLSLREKVNGTEHPDTLMTRMLMGPYLLDLGRIEEVEQAVTGIAASVATKGLLPTHKLYQELNTIEAALADAKAAGAATTPPQYEL